MKVLELYSGIGGMHFALKGSLISGDVIGAADINSVANTVYESNFTDVKVFRRNIQSLSAEIINKMGPDMILMSPPCQPFTRTGLEKDVSDRRCDSLIHLINILPDLSIKYLLIENVKGFETSDARALLLESLEKGKFSFQEFLLSPIQFGIPNNRLRYYLIARNSNIQYKFLFQPQLILEPILFEDSCKRIEIKDYLEIKDDSKEYEDFLLDDIELSKRITVYDIVSKESNRSCCFTKAYTRYAEGTGSVYSPFSNEETIKLLDEAKTFLEGSEQYLEVMKKLRLRYFTPREVANIMCFPKHLLFPNDVTKKQLYKLLGNSLNVYVVSYLINLMCS